MLKNNNLKLFYRFRNEVRDFENSILETVELISIYDKDSKNVDFFTNLIKKVYELDFETAKILSVVTCVKAKTEQEYDKEFEDYMHDTPDESLMNNKKFQKTAHDIKMLLETDLKTYEKQLNSTSDKLITQSDVNQICPITKKNIKNAVRNKKCNHVYEKISILRQLLEDIPVRCPMVGCVNQDPIKESDIENDVLLSRMLKVNSKEL